MSKLMHDEVQSDGSLVGNILEDGVVIDGMLVFAGCVFASSH